MEPSALYESPFTDIGPHGVEGIFASKEVEQLIDVLASIRQHAELLGSNSWLLTAPQREQTMKRSPAPVSGLKAEIRH
jgi:hypothetical protein